MATILLTVLCFWNTATAQHNQKPNIVFIYFDDMGYGDVSCLNPESKIRTPHIDRFAADGMTFTDAHAPAAVCTPSRYGILTGRYPFRSRLKYGVFGAFSSPLIEPDRITIAEMLKDNGYYTGMVGKWHLGQSWQLVSGGDYEKAYAEIYRQRGKFGNPGADFTKNLTNGPNEHGFDYSASRFITFAENGIPLGRVEVVKEHSKRGYLAPDFADVDQLPIWVQMADEFIQKASVKDQPFFLYYALTAPHTPHVPTEEFIGKSGIGLYGDFMLMCDWVVDELMKSLNDAGVDQNTVVFLTSDNGPENNTLALKDKAGHYSSGPYRGHKRHNFEGGHRVPTFVYWPGVVEPGSICDAPVNQVDLYATCAEIVGHNLGKTEAVDSWSLLPALKGKAGFERGEAMIHQNYEGNLAIRKGDWILMLHQAWKGMLAGYTDPDEPEVLDQEPFQLYNLADDVNERNNLYRTHPEKAAEMMELARKLVLNGRSTPGPRQANDEPFEFMEDWSQVDWTDAE